MKTNSALASLKLVSGRTRSKRPSKTQLLEQSQAAATLAAQQVIELSQKVFAFENPEQSEVVEAVKVAFSKRNRLAAVWGLIKGGWAPIASYFVAHTEVNGDYSLHPILSLLVAGALLFSAPTVYEWCMAAFNNRAKAVGFVVLLEGVMIFSKIHWLGVSAVVLLVAINGIQSGCNLAIRRKEPEFKF